MGNDQADRQIRDLDPGVLETLRFAPFPAADLARLAAQAAPGVHLIETERSFLRVRTAGTGPETIHLSDAPTTVEHFGPALPEIAQGRRVHVVEIPGFGFSWAKDPAALTFEGTVDALCQALNQLLDGPAVLSGLCVQAHVALAVAGARPDLVRGLVLAQATGWEQTRSWAATAIDPRGALGRPWQGQAMWRSTRERAAIDGWYRLAAAPGTDVSDWQETARQAFRRGATNSLPTLLQTWYAGPCPLPQLTVPSVLMWGPDDPTHAAAGSDPWAVGAYLPHAQRIVVPGGGHFLDLERPDLLAQAIASVGG